MVYEAAEHLRSAFTASTDTIHFFMNHAKRQFNQSILMKATRNSELTSWFPFNSFTFGSFDCIPVAVIS